MIKINKFGRGNTGIYVFGAVFLVVIASLMIWAVTSSRQEAIPSAGAPAGAAVTTLLEETKKGTASTGKIFVYDQESSTAQTPVSVPVYIQDETGAFVLDGDASSATRLSANTQIGRTLDIWAFNDSFYPVPIVDLEVKGEAPSIDLKVHKVSASLQLMPADDSAYSSSTTTNYGVNLTGVTANAVSTNINRIKVTNNGTYDAYNLAGFYVDALVGTNTTDVDLTGAASVSGIPGVSSVNIVDSTIPTSQQERIRNSNDYVFDIDSDSVTAGNQPLMLHQGDYINTGTLTTTWDGDGCPGEGDYLIVWAFDKSCYRSVKADGGIVCDAISNDAATQVDIGAGDRATIQIGCST